MDALTLLRDQAAFAEKLMTDVFGPVTVDQAVWQPEGSTANTIAALFLHIYTAEDRGIHRAMDKPTVFETGDWSDRLGYVTETPWARIARPDLVGYRAYATEVGTATRNFLAHVDPSALEREIETPRGKRMVITSLSLVLTTHKLTHMGEIAALLGCQGVKGFPF